MVRAWNYNGRSVVERLMRTLAVAMLAIGITACSGGSHRALPAPTTTTTTPPSLCHSAQVAASPSEFVPPVAGRLQLVTLLTKPLNGVVTATNAAGQRCTVTVPSNGQFTMYLDPGTYHFTGTSPRFESGSSPCRAPYPVVLRPRPIRSNGPSADAIVNCDGY